MQVNAETVTGCFNALLYRIGRWLFNRVPDLLPDYIYIHILWRKSMNYGLNLKDPQSYNEKLQWLKLYHRNPIYPTLVDKFSVKQWVSDKIGEEYIVRTLDVYDDVDSIQMDNLPDQFVLKCTHDSGSTVICRDKATFDFDACKKKLDRALHTDYYLSAREWPYKKVRRRIMAEEYLGDGSTELFDYKFFVFNGQVKFFKVDYNRWHKHGAKYYNRDSEGIGCEESLCPYYPYPLVLSDKVPEMMKLAEQIGAGFPHIRVDFYDVGGAVKFGECTFYPTGGFGSFTDDKWDYIFGKELVLTPSLKSK